MRKQKEPSHNQSIMYSMVGLSIIQLLAFQKSQGSERQRHKRAQMAQWYMTYIRMIIYNISFNK